MTAAPGTSTAGQCTRTCPVPHVVYTADVFVVAARHGVGAHSYADDTQLYHNTRHPTIYCEAIFARLMSCIDDAGHGCRQTDKLNTGKTQFT